MDYEKHFKRFTAYLSFVYIIGFLIINIRLSKYGIFEKDLLTLDFLKAGVLFIFVCVFPFILQYRITNQQRHWISKLFFHIGFIFFWCFSLKLIILVKHDLSWQDFMFLSFLMFMNSLFTIFYEPSNTKNDNRTDEILPAAAIMLFICYIGIFSTLIYGSIKYDFGGGEPYNKTLIFSDSNMRNDTINSTILYENKEHIYILKENIVEKISKKNIVKEIFEIQDK